MKLSSTLQALIFGLAAAVFALTPALAFANTPPTLLAKPPAPTTEQPIAGKKAPSAAAKPAKEVKKPLAAKVNEAKTGTKTSPATKVGAKQQPTAKIASAKPHKSRNSADKHRSKHPKPRSGGLAKNTIAPSLINANSITGTHFTAAKASLFLTVNGKSIPYQRFFYNALPHQDLHFVLSNTNEPYEMTIDGQPIKTEDQRNWHWRAPAQSGKHELLLIEKLTRKTLTLNLMVMSPLKSNLDRIRGFMIGRYPEPKDGKPEYAAPKGLIEVNAANENLYISPHFRLGQFICKQKGGYPQFISVQPDLIEKLELLLESVNHKGVRLDSFEIMSGFRTPFYNQLIQNVKHSRHIYGSASDIFIDVNPRDGVMDDLNGDRKFDKKDAAVLYELADQISSTRPYLAGGVGQYAGNGAHGPFVHVDVRGTEVRWGK